MVTLLSLPCPLPLALSFITPWFAWAGAGLISIPIIIHILNRRRFKVVVWAAMEYLLQAMRKNRRRLKFEQWLLLAVRCCVLLLLGLALARPLGCEDSSLASLVGQRNGLHVFIIQNSYSMAYEIERPNAKTQLDQAKVLAKGMIDRLKRGGESVAIITAGAAPASAGDKPGARAIISKPSYNLDACKTAVDGVTQSYGAADMAHALELALQIGRDEAKQPHKTLYIIHDGARSVWEGDQALALKQLGPAVAGLYHVVEMDLGKENEWNQAVLSLKPMDNLVTNKFPTNMVADVYGFGSGPAPLLQWKIDNKVQPGSAIVALDAQKKEQKLGDKVFANGGPHVISVSLAGDDRLKCDDTRYRIVDVAADMKVLVVEGERSLDAQGGSAATLKDALAPPSDNSEPGRGKTNSYVALDVISDIQLASQVLTPYRAICLADVAQIPPGEAAQLAGFVKEGGALLIFMGPHVNAANYNQSLVPPGLLPGKLIKVVTNNEKPMLFAFNPQSVHPYLHDFLGVADSGLGTAQIYSYWQLDLPANSPAQRVLDYLPAGSAPPTTQAATSSVSLGSKGLEARDPAITVHALGRGQVVYFSTTANGDWMNLPGKPAYTALIHELLGGSVGEGDKWMNLTVGQSLQIPPSVHLEGIPYLEDPAQRTTQLEPGDGKEPRDGKEASDAKGGPTFHSRPLVRPGLYRLLMVDAVDLKTKAGAQPERIAASSIKQEIPIAVNVPGDEVVGGVPEADLRVIPAEGIKKALGGIELAMQGDTLPPVGVSRDTGSDFGWYLLLALLVLVGVECFLAMHFGHYRRQPMQVTGPALAATPAPAEKRTAA